MIADENALKGDKIEDILKLQSDFDSRKANQKASYTLDRVDGTKYYIKACQGRVYEVNFEIIS